MSHSRNNKERIKSDIKKWQLARFNWSFTLKEKVTMQLIIYRYLETWCDVIILTKMGKLGEKLKEQLVRGKWNTTCK